MEYGGGVKSLFINGNDAYIKKDKIGFRVRYVPVENFKTDEAYLFIWSPFYFFGRCDLWKSSEGDILSITFYNGETRLYEFINHRFCYTPSVIS